MERLKRKVTLQNRAYHYSFTPLKFILIHAARGWGAKLPQDDVRHTARREVAEKTPIVGPFSSGSYYNLCAIDNIIQGNLNKP